MNWPELTTGAKAMAALTTTLVTAIIGGVLWAGQQYAPKDAFEEHVADARCERATDYWLKWRARLDDNPGSATVKEEERKARAVMERQCKGKG